MVGDIESGSAGGISMENEKDERCPTLAGHLFILEA